MKQKIIVLLIAFSCNCMNPPKQVKFADQDYSYLELAQHICSHSEPLILDVCVSCGSCPVTAAASVSMCPQSSLWCHLGISSATFCAFLITWINTTPLPEGSASEQLVTKLKKDGSHLLQLITKEKKNA